MKTLGEKVGEYLDKEGIHYHMQQRESTDIIFFTLGMDLFDIQMRIFCDNGLELILCMADAPVKIPEEKRIETMRLISRINFRVRYGALCLDETDGQLLARTALNTDGDSLTEQLFLIAWHTCVSLLDDHLSEIMGVVYRQDQPDYLTTPRSDVAC